MARKLEHNYIFTPSTNTIVLDYIYKPERILMIVNVTDSTTIFQFNDPQSGFVSVSHNYTLETTTIVVNYDCSSMSSTDKLQVWVENDAVTFEPSETYVDPVSKIRVSQPENLIDTDFEYGLQSQKWETLEQVKNIPTFFSRSGDESVELSSMTSLNGSDIITVTTLNNHGYARGIPIIVIGSKNNSCDGAFVVTNVLSTTVFQYKSKNIQTATVSILDTYTQLFTGSVYQGTEFDLSGISAITTDEAENSTLTVSTVYPTKFTSGTEFYLSNSISSVSQSINAENIQGTNSTTIEFNIDTTEELATNDYFINNTWDFRRYIPVNAWYFRMSEIDNIDISTDIITFTSAHALTNGYYYLDLGIGNANRISGINGDAYYWVHVHSSTSISLHSSYTGASDGTSNRYNLSLVGDASWDGGKTRCFFHRAHYWQSMGSFTRLQQLLTDFGESYEYFDNKLLSGPILLLGWNSSSATTTDINKDFLILAGQSDSYNEFSDTENLQYESLNTAPWTITSKYSSIAYQTNNYDDFGFSSNNPVSTREIIENPNFSSIYYQDHGLESNDAVRIVDSVGSTITAMDQNFEDDSYTKDVYIYNNEPFIRTVGTGTGDDGGFSSSEVGSTRHIEWGGTGSNITTTISSGYISGVYYNGALRSRLNHHAGSAVRYRSTSQANTTGTNIPYDPSLTTSNVDTSVTGGTLAAGYWTVSLPWTINFLGTSRTSVYVGTDGYLGIDNAYAGLTTITATSPSFRVIHVSANAAVGGNRIYTQTTGTSPNRIFNLRVRHSNGLEYEWKFLESDIYAIELHMLVNPTETEIEKHLVLKPLLNPNKTTLWNSNTQIVTLSFDAIRGSNSNGGKAFYSTSSIRILYSTNYGQTWYIYATITPTTSWQTYTNLPINIPYAGFSNFGRYLFRLSAPQRSSFFPHIAIDNIRLTFEDMVDTDVLSTVEKISNDRFRLKRPGSATLPTYNLIYGPNYTFTKTSDVTETDFISVEGHTLNENTVVVYDSNGNSEIPGLTNGSSYYIYQSAVNGFKLSNQDTGLIGDPVSYRLESSTSPVFATDNALNLWPTTYSTLVSLGWVNGDRIIYQPNDETTNIPGLTSNAFYFISLYSESGTAKLRLYRNQADALSANENYILIQWKGGTYSSAGTVQRTGLIDIDSASGIHKFVATSPGAADAVYTISEIVDRTTFNLNSRTTINSRPIGLNNISLNSKDNAVYLENHGLISGTPVTLTTTDTPPGELNDGSSTTFYVIRQSKDWIRLASTAEDVDTNIYLSLGDLGSGTNSLSTTSVSGETAASGTVSITDGSNQIIGIGTNFSAQFNVGDSIKIYIDETTVTKTVSSVSTVSDYFVVTSHGLSDGDVLRCIVSDHPDFVENEMIYVRPTGTADPTAQFTVHPTYNDAVNGTNAIDITGSNTGDIFEQITDIGSTIEAQISYVNSQTLMTVTENLSNTASGLQFALNTSLLVRANGFALHRPYDGGVELIPAENPDGQMIRQTRKYFRYQSGKGIQVSMAINFSPSVQIEEMLKIDTDSTATASITTRNPHRLTSGLEITVSGASVSSGENYWNGTFEVDSIIDDRTFTINLAGTPNDGSALGLVDFVVESWIGGVTRAGLFDDQNGLFYEYNGQTLYAVRRSATTQISGTCSVIFNSGEVRGIGTKFSSQLSVNDRIVIKGQSYVISEISSDELLYVMPSYRGTSNTGCIITKIIDTKIPQSSWNIDTCNGTGPSGYYLNIHKIQMAYIDYSWYGAGKARFGFKDQRGKVIYCHEFIHNNKQTEAYMRSGNLPARYEIENLGAPTYVPSLAHWGTSVIMDGRFDDDKAYVFTANSNPFSVTGESTLTISGRVELVEFFRIYDGLLYRAAGYAINIATPSGVYDSISNGFSISGANIPVGSKTTNPRYFGLPQKPYQPDVVSGYGTSNTSVNSEAVRNLLLIDQQPTGTSLTNSNYTVTLGGTTSVVYDQPLISIRLAPSVDNGTPGPLGSREIINRMQLILNSVGILTTHSVEISLKLNGRLSANEWSRVTNPSLSQLIYHQNGDTVTGGATIYSFRAQGTAGTSNRTQALTTEQLDDIATLGNSILGGDATFPDGPDVLTVVARLVEDPSTVSSSNPFNISGRISWSESQA